MSGPLSTYSASARAAGEAALEQTALQRSTDPLAERRRRLLSQTCLAFAGGEFSLVSEDISEPTEWTIEHDCHTLIVHLQGRMQHLETRIDGGRACRAPARPGEAWLIPAGAYYVGRADGGNIAYAEFRIKRAWLSGLGRGAPGDPLRPLMKQRDPLLHGLTGRMIQLADADDDLAGMLRDTMAEVVGLHLLREYPAGVVARPARTPPSLSEAQQRRLQDYILAHLDQHLGLEELARLAGIGRHRLIEAFRHCFGMTPMQYIIAQRLQLACGLLESTRQDITSIALATGFSSHSHLSSAFKRRYGITPRQFRAQAKGISGA
ncbi:helix-turn-helix domain-containing protein [Lysobacter maris]|uniref:Helix-turn-helix domain-containing protein n=1 Tax=Marilutibacter maris TaxID=1605891 RepID=A0A508B555_9GAMM|nr:AraC family transcriptional regulator [Lysobacter maris]KAB8198373.1 helix-turn-helix domain-containing protein [Lysobacter maris]